jgi:RNA polymerase sigma-70 factor (ECF subfamily)
VAATPADLFERHHGAIYRYLLRTTGSREIAEDITQEVFLRVIKGLDGYQDIDHERAWLFRIAHNLRCDHTRRAYRQPAPSSLNDVEASEPARQHLQFSLSEALAKLGEDDREAFVLAEIGGLSYADIATICGTSSSAVRSRIYRARLALRDALTPLVERRLARNSYD